MFIINWILGCICVFLLYIVLIKFFPGSGLCDKACLTGACPCKYKPVDDDLTAEQDYLEEQARK